MEIDLNQIEKEALEDAKSGNYRPDEYPRLTPRLVYVKAYLGAREKMGMLGKMGPGKEIKNGTN